MLRTFGYGNSICIRNSFFVNEISVALGFKQLRHDDASFGRRTVQARTNERIRCNPAVGSIVLWYDGQIGTHPTSRTTSRGEVWNRTLLRKQHQPLFSKASVAGTVVPYSSCFVRQFQEAPAPFTLEEGLSLDSWVARYVSHVRRMDAKRDDVLCQSYFLSSNP